MSNNLESLWLIDPDGSCLMHRAFDINLNYMDETMFSGFLTAILAFAGDTLDDTVERISLGEKDVYCVSFGTFIVVVSTKKGSKQKDLMSKVNEVGQRFKEQYDHILTTHNLMETSLFEPFAAVIDEIFGIETVKIVEEHDQLLLLLREAEKNQWTEEETLEQINQFLASLNRNTLEIVLKTTKDILVMLGLENVELVQEITRLKNLLRDASEKGYSEEVTVRLLVLFLDGLEKQRRRQLIKSSREIFEMFGSSKELDPVVRKEYHRLTQL